MCFKYIDLPCIYDVHIERIYETILYKKRLIWMYIKRIYEILIGQLNAKRLKFPPCFIFNFKEKHYLLFSLSHS